MSWGWWLLYIPMLLVGYVVLEYVGDYVGTWTLDLPFWKRMPSWARVLLLATSFWLVIIAVVVLVNLVRT